MLVNWGWGPEVFLEPVPKVSASFPIYFSGQLMCGHLNLYMTQLFGSLLSLSLGP